MEWLIIWVRRQGERNSFALPYFFFFFEQVQTYTFEVVGGHLEGVDISIHFVLDIPVQFVLDIPVQSVLDITIQLVLEWCDCWLYFLHKLTNFFSETLVLYIYIYMRACVRTREREVYTCACSSIHEWEVCMCACMPMKGREN